MKIKQVGDPILRTLSRTVSKADFESDLVNSTVQTMQDILNGIKAISDENGNALSAPQVGVGIRLIVLRMNGKFVNIINPRIIERSESTFMFEEECFSFYNMRATVRRYESVVISFIDENQNEQRLSMQGEFSGLIQHEIDHLNGIFFLDKVEDQSSLVSIDYLLKDEPERLTVVKSLCEYMASD